MNKQQPMFSSMHTHTLFCDGKDDVETMCRTAYEKQLTSIGFSAHAPIEKQTGKSSEWNLKEDKIEDYIVEVLAAKERWLGKLDVFLGYEADYIKGRRSPLDSDIIALNLDYIIGSVHYLYPENGSEGFTVDGSIQEFNKGLKEGYNNDPERLMHSYYDAVAEMITAGGFDILGHADLIKKNTQGKYSWLKEGEINRQREIAHLASKAGIVIEVNTGGLNRNKTVDVYPSLSFLQLFREYNVPVIITSDAHKAKDLDGNYDIAIKTLNLANFKEHMLFIGKFNGKAVWQKENIYIKKV
ncbi:MAG: histidinol-phosphatase [Treponema sp.]|nr:histidinol-phosphatase [Treponema sp.]